LKVSFIFLFELFRAAGRQIALLIMLGDFVGFRKIRIWSCISLIVMMVVVMMMVMIVIRLTLWLRLFLIFCVLKVLSMIGMTRISIYVIILLLIDCVYWLVC